MSDPVAQAIERFTPRAVDAAAASFARAVVADAGPPSAARAKALLFAASRLACFAESVGLKLDPDVVLCPSVIERFVLVGCVARSAATRRTMRTNLRAIARRTDPGAPVPALGRERAKEPYSKAQIAAYLALADAQPTRARALRASALVCLGAGAGLVGADLKAVTGTDIVTRCGGVVVVVGHGRCPRVVPVLARYHERLGLAAADAGEQLLIGGTPRHLEAPRHVAVRGGQDDRAARLHGRGRRRLLPAPGRPRGPPRAGRRGRGRRALGRARVSGPGVLGRLEAVVDASGVAPGIEALLPVGVRPRQLKVRTLLVGILMVLADGRPAHLTRVHAALVSLDEPDRRRLGVSVQWPSGSHALTYRQVERTFCLVVAALAKERPDGSPTDTLQEVLDALLEASVPEVAKEASRALALDWTDVESFSTRRTKPLSGAYADREAAWGHRKGGGPGEKDEVFFGYYLSLATMVRDGGSGQLAELVRRMQVGSCDHDPVPAMVAVVVELPKAGIPLGDVMTDSGYAHRVPAHFALPLRAAGASLVMDLHPHDRGTQGTFEGALLWNGNLYCPATPGALFDLGPLGRAAGEAEVAAHDEAVAELARYKLGRISAPDAEGFSRVACPAVIGKLRCPARKDSMALDVSRPEVASVPEHPPSCCTQQTITVPPSVNAKTTQRHDYLSQPWRRSYARRSASERANARIKDPATIDIARGWCRVMGLAPTSLLLAYALVVRNLAVADAFEARRSEDERRARVGLPRRTRRRQRTTLGDLAGASATAPP